MCTEYLEDFSCFIWMTLNKSPNWNDAEPHIQFLMNNGMQVDDVKCFDQVSREKSVASHLSDDEFTTLLAHQKWIRYSENSKNGVNQNC
jgi:hypothetical protein